MSVTTVRRAAAAALGALLVVPAGLAEAATVAASAVPAPHRSLNVAGYQQTGCHFKSYPVYIEISGTVKVPAATDVNGTPGISYEVYNIGGINTGVSGGVAVDNAGGQATYTAFGEWKGAPTTAFQVQPGDKLQVTIEDEGQAGWMVEIFDAATQQEWAQTSPDPSATRCKAGAYLQSPYPAYDHTTKTSTIVFSYSRVWWGERGQGKASVSKLLGKLPAHARLNRFTLGNANGSRAAVTSAPQNKNNNFTITDK
jgi:hypothetical protein